MKRKRKKRRMKKKERIRSSDFWSWVDGSRLSSITNLISHSKSESNPMLRSRIKISKINSTLIRNITSATRSRLVQASEVHRSISTVPISQSTTSGSRIQSRKWNGLHSLNNSRFIHSSCSSKQRDSTTGGIPNDGSHPTVYEWVTLSTIPFYSLIVTHPIYFFNLLSQSDFFNLLEGGLPQAVEVKSMSSTSFTLTDGLVISQPCIFLNGAVFLWDPPHLDRLKATPGGNGWEEWNQDVWTLFEISSPKPGEWIKRGREPMLWF